MNLKNIYKRTKAVLFSTYYSYFYKKALNEKKILLESKHGDDLAGNIFHILQQLNSETYHDYDVYLSCLKKKRKEIKTQLKRYQLDRIKLVTSNRFGYYKCIATAKYLFTDTTFGRTYVKKDGQILINTWHGTPLKKMGRDDIQGAFAMGNVQRNLVQSDYLIYPNEYMKEKMVEAYELQNIYQGKILCEGYPRNSIFFDQKAGQWIREKILVNGDAKIYLYMPTWRGTLSNKETTHFVEMLKKYFDILDSKLKKNQLFYVKLHPFVKEAVDLSGYQQIKPYPAEYEVYEFLAMCDGLVTDYSSVFFDFANTRKKIILFAYDEKEYQKKRGLYIELNELPFPVVKTVEALVKELDKPKDYNDEAFLKKYCTYDRAGAAERICLHVIKGQIVCKEEKLEKNLEEKKENVLIYGSSLDKNGLTTSLLNLLESIDLTKRNYFISFTEKGLRKEPERICQLPKTVGILPISSGAYYNLIEMIAYVFYTRGNVKNKWIEKKIECLYKKEWRKHFGGIVFKHVIHFTGYDKTIIKLFQYFDGEKTIFVHNNMLEEMKTRHNQHYLTLKSAYQNYDHVAVVTEDMIPSTVEISKRRDNIIIVNNCHPYQKVIKRSQKVLQFDEDTICNVDFKELGQILDHSVLKFITIGRFSPEKGHKMLIDAFDLFVKKQNKVKALEEKNRCDKAVDIKEARAILIIVGGFGEQYEETLSYAKLRDNKDIEGRGRIVVIRSMKNPMPLLKRCDLFILSSYYEGLGLVLLEADTLSIPVISTDILGPQGFLKKYGGYRTEVSKEGIALGMEAFVGGRIKPMNVDYNVYNQRAVEQFEALLTHKENHLLNEA